MSGLAAVGGSGGGGTPSQWTAAKVATVVAACAALSTLAGNGTVTVNTIQERIDSLVTLSHELQQDVRNIEAETAEGSVDARVIGLSISSSATRCIVSTVPELAPQPQGSLPGDSLPTAQGTWYLNNSNPLAWVSSPQPVTSNTPRYFATARVGLSTFGLSGRTFVEC